MISTNRWPLLAALVLPLLPLSAMSVTVPPPPPEPVEFDGHYYVVIDAPGISWNDASAAAMQMSYNGEPGHLATITSADEDTFIESLRVAAQLKKPEAWVGGFQASPCTPDPGCGWQWINNEGPIGTTQIPRPSYSNWLANEPNDLGMEQYLGVGLRDTAGWNDEQNLANIGGYVVEFDTEVPAENCANPGGCATTSGQVLAFPPTVDIPAGASLGLNTFEFTDDPARCGVAPLVLFDDDGIDDNELIIPPYLCGSPKFKVVAIDSSSVDVLQGTILVENEVTVVLPNNLYECTGPINPGPVPDPDPQYRDVVAWQSTDPSRMLDNALGAAFGFPGALTEVTNECGSSRGRVKGASYYVIGMHIDFGPGFEYANNAAGNNYMFVALTRYKLEVLKVSIDDSHPALNRWRHRVLQFFIRAAIALHDRDRFTAANFTVKALERLAEASNYSPVPGQNYQGEHLMRSGNIQFMYTEKVIPFAP